MDDGIRQIIAEHGRMSTDVGGLSRTADLYDAGLTSHACVSVMLALEEQFEVEFPEHMLIPSVFASVSSISRALNELRSSAAVA